LGVTGTISIDGRKTIKSESIGTNFAAGKEKLVELIAGRDDAFDENETESVMERILHFMKEKKSTKRKPVSTNDILKNIKTRSGRLIITHAIQKLYSTGEITLQTHGKYKKWSLGKVY